MSALNSAITQDAQGARIWPCLVLAFLCCFLVKFIQAYLSHKNHSLHVQKNHLILGKQLAGTQLLSRQSRQATAAAGGLLIGIKQLWRPATLWELGDVAGPPPSSPSPSEQAGFRGIVRLDFGLCTSVEAKHKLGGGDGQCCVWP